MRTARPFTRAAHAPHWSFRERAAGVCTDAEASGDASCGAAGSWRERRAVVGGGVEILDFFFF